MGVLCKVLFLSVLCIIWLLVVKKSKKRCGKVLTLGDELCLYSRPATPEVARARSAESKV